MKMFNFMLYCLMWIIYSIFQFIQTEYEVLLKNSPMTSFISSKGLAPEVCHIVYVLTIVAFLHIIDRQV